MRIKAQARKPDRIQIRQIQNRNKGKCTCFRGDIKYYRSCLRRPAEAIYNTLQLHVNKYINIYINNIYNNIY